jgi:capsular polysaccharide export protein
MARVILHIGQSKTGTTAIQHFLAANRDGLRRAGILYPDIRNRGVALGATDHNLVAWALIGKVSRIGVPIREFMADVERELEQDGHLHTVILSAEAFMGEPHIWEFESVADWRAANLAKIECLRQLLSDHDVSVFAYLRRQDYWVNSAFNHIVKTEGLIGRQIYANIQEFIDNIAPRLDYAAELDIWARHFGRHALIIHPYEKAQLHEGDAVTDFCRRTGLAGAITNDFRRPSAIEAANLGLPRDIFELKRILNRIPKSKPEERVLIWAMQTLSASMPSPDKQWDFLLSSAERNELFKRLGDCNLRLTEYFGIEAGKPFFREPLPAVDPARDYPGLSIAKAAEVAIRLHRLRKSFAARRLYLRYVLGDLLRRRFLGLYWMLRPVFLRFGR